MNCGGLVFPKNCKKLFSDFFVLFETKYVQHEAPTLQSKNKQAERQYRTEKKQRKTAHENHLGIWSEINLMFRSLRVISVYRSALVFDIKCTIKQFYAGMQYEYMQPDSTHFLQQFKRLAMHRENRIFDVFFLSFSLLVYRLGVPYFHLIVAMCDLRNENVELEQVQRANSEQLTNQHKIV